MTAARLAGFLGIAVVAAGCTSHGSSAVEATQEDWYPREVLTRPDLQLLVDAGLNRETEPLARALTSDDPLIRSTAVCALASVQAASLRKSLYARLLDGDVRVRRCTAFAVGLLGPDDVDGARALLDALDRESDAGVRTALLEAIGKTGSRSDLEQVLARAGRVTRIGDVGLSLSLFHFARRRITHPGAAPHIIALIGGSDEHAATIAALALSSSRDISAWGLRPSDVRSALDAMPWDRRAAGPLLAAIALEADPQDAARARAWLAQAEDWTVRVAAATALGPHVGEDARAIEALVDALNDPSPHVATAAAQALARHASRAGAQVSWEDLIRSHLNRPAVAAVLLPALVRTSAEPLMLAWARGQLGVRPSYSWPALARLATPEADTLLVRGLRGERRDAYAAASALADRFETTERSDPLRARVAGVLVNRLTLWGPHAPSSDIRGLTRLLEIFAADSSPAARTLVTRAMSHWHPQVRAVAGAQRAIAEDSISDARQSINWPLLSTAGERPRVEVRTNRGAFVVELRPLNAPLAVSALLEHAAAGRLSGLVFHRVEPDFILQSGDFDNRLGFGGPERGLRSEFSLLRFSPGVMGMASAGKDTEGSQYFLTHNYAHSLDGRYSAIGQIISGQQVADAVALGDSVTMTVLSLSPHSAKAR